MRGLCVPKNNKTLEKNFNVYNYYALFLVIVSGYYPECNIETVEEALAAMELVTRRGVGRKCT